MKERVQKIIAQAGICSRRAAETYITAGRVTIDGRKAHIGDQADPKKQRVCVDGKPILKKEAKVYLMLHKPRGFVTTMRDERGRRDVSALVKDCGARVFPVGRLDHDSEGLLLMTNDGDLAYRLTHPRHEMDKTYQVSVRGDLKRVPDLAQPMEIDGYVIQPARVFMLRQEEENRAILQIVIHEGRNRQIRKMCEQCGLTVLRLKREKIGKLELDPSLPVGKWRELTLKELQYLGKTIEKSEKAAAEAQAAAQNAVQKKKQHTQYHPRRR